MATAQPITDRSSAKVITAGSSTEAVIGLGAGVLGLLALIGVLPIYLAPIATIAAGAALFVEGMAIAARYNRLARSLAHNEAERLELGGGASTQILTGLGGVALGILALVNVAPITLMAVAVIAMGGGLLFGGGAASRINWMVLGDDSRSAEIARHAVRGATGTEILVGLGSIALGVLALSNVVPLVLVSVALMSIGAAAFMSGSALTSRIGQEL